jgi:hypothetical protein
MRGGVEQPQRRPEEVPHLLRPLGYLGKEHVEMTTTTLWRYDDPAWAEIDLVGYDVEAVDGAIGKIEWAIEDIGTRYLVVDTRPWVFGKKVMLPAGIVECIDVTNKRVHVGHTKDGQASARIQRGAAPRPEVSRGVVGLLRPRSCGYVRELVSRLGAIGTGAGASGHAGAG